MIKTIIVEDEKNIRENLQKLLKEYCPQVEIIAVCGSAKEGRKAIIKHKPDLIFLDIEMPEENGFQMLERIPSIDFEVVFATAFDQYGIKAIKFCALDYLLKPIDITELLNAIKKVEERIQEKSANNRILQLINNKNFAKSSKKIALPLSDKIEFVEVQSIIRCQSEGNYTHFFLKNGQKLMVSKTLKEYDELLTDSGFLRTHQSHLINLKEIKSFVKSDGGYIVMNDGSTAYISRQRRETVQDHLKLICK